MKLLILVIIFAALCKASEKKIDSQKSAVKVNGQKVEENKDKGELKQTEKVDEETKDQLEGDENDEDTKIKETKEQSNNLETDDDGDAAESDSEGENQIKKDDMKKKDGGEDDKKDEKKEDKNKNHYVLHHAPVYAGDYFGHYGGVHHGGHHFGGSGGGHLGGLQATGPLGGLGGPAEFYPGAPWQYPFPYWHPGYPNPMWPMCSCKCDDKDDKDKKSEKDKKKGDRQLIPCHYYGPPHAGWGHFRPGRTGAGWGAPYWYKSKIPTAEQNANRRQGIENFMTEEYPDISHGGFGEHGGVGRDLGGAFGLTDAHESFGHGGFSNMDREASNFGTDGNPGYDGNGHKVAYGGWGRENLGSWMQGSVGPSLTPPAPITPGHGIGYAYIPGHGHHNHHTPVDLADEWSSSNFGGGMFGRNAFSGAHFHAPDDDEAYKSALPSQEKNINSDFKEESKEEEPKEEESKEDESKEQQSDFENPQSMKIKGRNIKQKHE